MRGTIQAFESSRQKTNLWLKEVAAELRTEDRRKAYAALRAVLHALRDCLPVEETAKFSAQMPLLMQGVFFEGWKPHRKPHRFTRQEFFEHLRRLTRGNPDLDPGAAARAVFVVLGVRLSAGEIESARRVLPHDVRELWYELGHRPPVETLAESEAEEPRMPEPREDAFRVYEAGSGGAPAWP